MWLCMYTYLLLCIMYDVLPTWYIMICQFNIYTTWLVQCGTIEQYVTIKLFIISPTWLERYYIGTQCVCIAQRYIRITSLIAF